jgi:hypothetical protein
VHIERKVGATVAIAGSLLLAAGAAAPALAGTAPGARFALATGVRFADAANGTSTTFGGWTFTPKTAKSVTTEFKVPTLKCTKTATGIGPIAVLITGTSSAQNFNAAGLLLECQSGSPAAAAAVVVDGASTVGTSPLAAGDLIQSTVSTTATKTTVTVADLTKGHTFKLSKSGKGAAALEELIMDDSLANSTTGAQLPVASFGTIGYSSAAVSGKAIGTVTPSMGVNMQTKKKVLQILTGPITGAKKNAFTTTFKHS